MKEYNLTAKVTISIYTTVEANSLEEAIEIAKEREEIEKSHWGEAYKAKEMWLTDDFDGTPFDIEIED